MRFFMMLLAALCVALPAYAKMSDAEARKLAEAMSDTFNADWNKGDAKGLAALFTENGTLITPAGRLTGTDAIENDLAHAAGKSVHTTTVDEAHPVAGGASWAAGSFKVEGPNGHPAFGGYWTSLYVRSGGAWKMRLLMINATPPKAAEAAK
jgi:ketosteroid isomerase-like protein